MIFELGMITTSPQADLVRTILGFAGMREDWGKVGKKITKDVQFYTNTIL